jgi:hypothetical protein
MPEDHFINADHELFEKVLTDVLHRIHSELPQPVDQPKVRQMTSEWIVGKIQLGERDRSRLALGATAHVRKVLYGANAAIAPAASTPREAEAYPRHRTPPMHQAPPPKSKA